MGGSSFVVTGDKTKGKKKARLDKALKKKRRKHRDKDAVGSDSKSEKIRLKKKKRKHRERDRDEPTVSKSKELVKADTLALNPSVKGKLKKKLKKVKELKAEIGSKVDLEKLAADVKSGALKIPKRALTNPSSEEDFRYIHIRKIVKLHKIAKIIEDEILGSDKATNKVYQLGQIYAQIDASVEALQNLKTPEMRIHILNRKVLEPAFRKVIGTLTDIVGDITREMKKVLGDSVGKSKSASAQTEAEFVIKEVVRKKSGELQTIYDTAMEQLENVAEEDL